MKKAYIEPTAKTVELKFTQTLLAGSEHITNVTSNLSEGDAPVGYDDTPIEEGVWGR